MFGMKRCSWKLREAEPSRTTQALAIKTDRNHIHSNVIAHDAIAHRAARLRGGEPIFVQSNDANYSHAEIMSAHDDSLGAGTVWRGLHSI